MRTPKPLPPELIGREFTRAEALSLGVSFQRLRAGDLTRVGRRIYTAGEPSAGIEQRARSLSAANPQAWISHETAAIVEGLFLPAHLALSAEFHLSCPHRLPAVRQPGVVGHSVRAHASEVLTRSGFRISTPARTWLDLARRLPLEDLVALGDQLIRIPRPALEAREAPWATMPSLTVMLSRHPNLQGIVRAREALELMRLGSDSVPETKLRLFLTDSGLPEPELQVRIDPSDPRSPAADLGYRRWKIAIQYDGGGHLTPEQQERDNRRDEAFNIARWTYFKFNRVDLKDDFGRAVSAIRRAILNAAA